MSNGETVDPKQTVELLESGVVKYAFEVQARDAIHGYIRRWAVMLALVAAAAGYFGWSLRGGIEHVTKKVDEAGGAIETIERRSRELDQRLQDLEKSTGATLAEIEEKRAAIEKGARDVDENVKKVSDKTLDYHFRANDALRTLIGEQQQLAQTARTARKDAETARRDADNVQKEAELVKAQLEKATLSAEEVERIRVGAEQTKASLARQNLVIGSTMVDAVTLRSQRRPATIELRNIDGGGPFVVTFTCESINKTGFYVDYEVGGTRRTVHIVPSEKRVWHPIEGTSGQYRFCVDFVYSFKTAPDFLTLRIAATDEALRPSEAQVARMQE